MRNGSGGSMFLTTIPARHTHCIRNASLICTSAGPGSFLTSPNSSQKLGQPAAYRNL